MRATIERVSNDQASRPMPVPYSSEQVYLSQEAEDLVIHHGYKSSRMEHSETKILVIGGGVTGLTVRHILIILLCKVLILFQTSWALLDAGYSVTVVSDRWASEADRITSQIAGAL